MGASRRSPRRASGPPCGGVGQRLGVDAPRRAAALSPRSAPEEANNHPKNNDYATTTFLTHAQSNVKVHNVVSAVEVAGAQGCENLVKVG